MRYIGGSNQKQRGVLFFTICLLLSISLGVAILADDFIPSVRIDHSSIIFYAQRSIILTLVLCSLIFLLCGLLITWVTVKGSQTPNAKNLLWRRLVALTSAFALSVLLSFFVVYLGNKRVTITDEGMRIDTLFSTREITWIGSDVIDYNFVAATRLGPPFTASPHALIVFRTREGETVHFDLRFIGHNRFLKQVIQQYVDLDPPR